MSALTTVCPKHRDANGIRWRTGRVMCSVSTEVAGHKSASNRGDRGIDCKQSCFIFQETGILMFHPSQVSGKSLKATKSCNSKTTPMRPGVGVRRGANVKQTMLYYNVFYMFFHSSSLQDRRYFCAFFRRARR